MRLFVALEPPEVLKAELTQALGSLQKQSRGGINWVKPQNLHLTLLFIGEVPDHQVQAVAQAAETRAKNFAAPALKARGLDLFPARDPRLLGLKLNEDEPSLTKLNRLLLNDLRELQLDPDAKALKLHITLGRIKNPQTPDFERSALSYPIAGDIQRWDTLTLYRSTLKPDGPVYNSIQQYYL